MAGYLFINIFHLTKFRAQHHDGYRLLLESTLIGVVIFVLARILGFWAEKIGWIANVHQFVRQEGITYQFSGTAVLSCGIAVLAAYLGNWVVGAERAKGIIVRLNDNGFLRLFHRALSESRMVSVTLSSKKVYIGYVLRTPNLTPKQQFVGILPVVSGYRDKDTLQLTVVTNYAQAISANPEAANDFEVTFCLDSIESANLFDPQAYPLFESDRKTTTPQTIEPPRSDQAEKAKT